MVRFVYDYYSLQLPMHHFLLSIYFVISGLKDTLCWQIISELQKTRGFLCFEREPGSCVLKAYNKSHIFLLSPVQWQVKLDVLEEDTPFKPTVNKTEVHRIFFLGILRKVSTSPLICSHNQMQATLEEWS